MFTACILLVLKKIFYEKLNVLIFKQLSVWLIINYSPQTFAMATRKLRMGMIGGGKDAFIGAIHRIAANMDGQIELACGALSIVPDIARESGKQYFLPEDRIYLTYD